jgi:hypothetical protein
MIDHDIIYGHGWDSSFVRGGCGWVVLLSTEYSNMNTKLYSTSTNSNDIPTDESMPSCPIKQLEGQGWPSGTYYSFELGTAD